MTTEKQTVWLNGDPSEHIARVRKMRSLAEHQVRIATIEERDKYLYNSGILHGEDETYEAYVTCDKWQTAVLYSEYWRRGCIVLTDSNNNPTGGALWTFAVSPMDVVVQYRRSTMSY